MLSDSESLQKPEDSALRGQIKVANPSASTDSTIGVSEASATAASLDWKYKLQQATLAAQTFNPLHDAQRVARVSSLQQTLARQAQELKAQNRELGDEQGG